MTPALASSVELLERSLSYTRARLAEVDGALLDRPTPCARWRLADLLVHMDDSLDAFTEAAGGAVQAPTRQAYDAPTRSIQAKACALLGAWSGPSPGDVVVGDLDLTSGLLVATAALEITVHGWDVGQATGTPEPIPAGLAEELLPVAHATVAADDRGTRFADALGVPTGAGAGERLLAFLGRRG